MIDLLVSLTLLSQSVMNTYFVFSFLKVVDVCTSSPCQNGDCIANSDGSGYMCDCPQGYEGTHCENGEVANFLSMNRSNRWDAVITIQKSIQ